MARMPLERRSRCTRKRESGTARTRNESGVTRRSSVCGPAGVTDATDAALRTR
jgi:hypothetical protein